MITLAEKIASLSPERRKRVEERANELIAQERSRRAGELTKRRRVSGKGRRFAVVVKRCYARKASATGVKRHGYRPAHSVVLSRL